VPPRCQRRGKPMMKRGQAWGILDKLRGKTRILSSRIQHVNPTKGIGRGTSRFEGGTSTWTKKVELVGKW